MITLAHHRRELVLGVRPTSRSTGWALFESPLAPADWGTVDIRTDRNARTLAFLGKLIDRYQPAILVLEELGEPGGGRRVGRLNRAILQLGYSRGLDTRVYHRAVIRTCFASLGAMTRYEIAQAIAAHVDALRHRLPKPRKPWMNESQSMALFDAASLAITYFALVGEA